MLGPACTGFGAPREECLETLRPSERGIQDEEAGKEVEYDINPLRICSPKQNEKNHRGCSE